MSGINGPDGINPSNILNGRSELKKVDEKKPSFVKFGGFHTPSAGRVGNGIDSRLSPTVLAQFELLQGKFENVAFCEYPEEGRIPQLEIGEDYIEDIPQQECEV